MFKTFPAELLAQIQNNYTYFAFKLAKMKLQFFNCVKIVFVIGVEKSKNPIQSDGSKVAQW